MQLFKNNAYSTLAGTLLIAGTSMTVATGTGDRFPVVAGSDFAMVTLQDASNHIEIVKVTARTIGSDAMTIARAQEGTTALNWAIGDIVECRLTAASVAPLQVYAGAATATAMRTALGSGLTGDSIFQAADVPTVQSIVGIFPGMLFDFAGTAAPAGYLLCDGSAVSRTTYATLFSAIGTTWGAGNGTTTFNVPDLRRKTTIGAGGTAVSGPANTVGSTGGAETQVIAAANLPVHTHTVNITSGAMSANAVHGHNDTGHAHATGNNPAAGGGGASLAEPGFGGTSATAASSAAITNTNTDHTHNVSGNTGNGPGTGTALSVMPPSAVVTKIIKT